eukprot:gene232-410_t
MGLFWNRKGVITSATRAAVAAVRDECGYAYETTWSHTDGEASLIARVSAEYMQIDHVAWESVNRAALQCGRMCYLANDLDLKNRCMLLCMHRVEPATPTTSPQPPKIDGAASTNVGDEEVLRARDRALAQSVEYVWRQRTKHATTFVSEAGKRHWDDATLKRLIPLCEATARDSRVRSIINSDGDGGLVAIQITCAHFVPFATLQAIAQEAPRMVCDDRRLRVDVRMHEATLVVTFDNKNHYESRQSNKRQKIDLERE